MLININPMQTESGRHGADPLIQRYLVKVLAETSSKLVVYLVRGYVFHSIRQANGVTAGLKAAIQTLLNFANARFSAVLIGVQVYLFETVL